MSNLAGRVIRIPDLLAVAANALSRGLSVCAVVRVAVHALPQGPVSACCSARVFPVVQNAEVRGIDASLGLAHMIQGLAFRDRPVDMFPGRSVREHNMPLGSVLPSDLCVAVAGGGVCADPAVSIQFPSAVRAFTDTFGHHYAVPSGNVRMGYCHPALPSRPRCLLPLELPTDPPAPQAGHRIRRSPGRHRCHSAASG